jgi:GNAT superfamily N-acetyltransferase
MLEANGHIDCFYTHASHQGQGIGTALLGAIESKSKELGLVRLFTEASITARPFFESKGFVVLAQQEVECRGQRFVNFRMEKWLSPGEGEAQQPGPVPCNPGEAGEGTTHPAGAGRAVRP